MSTEIAKIFLGLKFRSTKSVVNDTRCLVIFTPTVLPGPQIQRIHGTIHHAFGKICYTFFQLIHVFYTTVAYMLVTMIV